MGRTFDPFRSPQISGPNDWGGSSGKRSFAFGRKTECSEIWKETRDNGSHAVQTAPPGGGPPPHPHDHFAQMRLVGRTAEYAGTFTKDTRVEMVGEIQNREYIAEDDAKKSVIEMGVSCSRSPLPGLP